LAEDPWAYKETEKLESGDYHIVELERRRQVLGLRATWSKWLIAWISFLLVFQAGLGVCIGSGLLSFEKHPNVLGFLLGQNFVQIVGMGYVVVKWLFPQKAES
jgi:hypothetical protein